MARLELNADGGTQAAVQTVTLWLRISVLRGAKMPVSRNTQVPLRVLDTS